MAQWSCNTGRQPSNGLTATLTGFQTAIGLFNILISMLKLIDKCIDHFFLPIIQKDELLIFSSYKEWNHFLLQLVAVEVVFHNWTSTRIRCKNNSEYKLLFLRISCLKVVDKFLGACPRLASPWNGTFNFPMICQSLPVFVSLQIIMTGICPSPIKLARLHPQINVCLILTSLKIKQNCACTQKRNPLNPTVNTYTPSEFKGHFFNCWKPMQRGK